MLNKNNKKNNIKLNYSFGITTLVISFTIAAIVISIILASILSGDKNPDWNEIFTPDTIKTVNGEFDVDGKGNYQEINEDNPLYIYNQTSGAGKGIQFKSELDYDSSDTNYLFEVTNVSIVVQIDHARSKYIITDPSITFNYLNGSYDDIYLNPASFENSDEIWLALPLHGPTYNLINLVLEDTSSGDLQNSGNNYIKFLIE